MRRTMASLIVALGAALALDARVTWSQESALAVDSTITPEQCRHDRRLTLKCQRLGLLYWNGDRFGRDLAKAADYLDAACRAGVWDACRQQGWLLVEGHPRTGDVERGARLLGSACDRKDFAACTVLGGAYASGTDLPRDAKKAAKLLDKGCEADQAPACAALAGLLETGDGIAADRPRASVLMQQACAFGMGDACEKACADGDGASCAAWGAQVGLSESVDRAKVDAAYRRACDAGVAEGCYRMAERTSEPAEAVAFDQKACALGDAWGCARVAEAHYLGRGVPADPKAAADLYALACDKGSHTACIVLGGMLARGELGASAPENAQQRLAQGCGDDVPCRAIVANGRVPAGWGDDLESLRPDRNMGIGPLAYDRAPRTRSTAPAQYPKDALARKVRGMVLLELRVDARGSVADVRVARSIPGLDEAAVACARKWQFEPAQRGGVAVSIVMMAPVMFRPAVRFFTIESTRIPMSPWMGPGTVEIRRPTLP